MMENMTERLRLPVGIDSFEKIRRGGYYYIDKTKLIRQILDNPGEVNLFTRPRRFGKTLNMSMLRSFFEIGTEEKLFEGLYICQNQKLCQAYMGKFPVIFLSLKGVDGLTFDSAKYRLTEVIGKEARRFRFLADSEKLDETDKNVYQAMVSMREGQYLMDGKVLASSVHILSELLYKHYGRKAIILIDEYDVPLDKAFQNGYYREMVDMVRTLFGQALKTNDYLQFAVLTGCLRISKESIFTGLNNFKVLSITDPRFDEQFGFTEEEVKSLLSFYHLASHLEEIKEWYDGYHFGDANIYCPWDVINHVDRLTAQPDARPEAYWINTSGNGLVRRFIDKAGKTTRDELEGLICGQAIEKFVRQELTYDEIDNSIENLWSVLFTTGYLTHIGMTDQGAYRLVIPNKEVREVYKLQIREWFKQKIFSNTAQLTAFWNAVETGDTAVIENYLNRTLSNSISFYDTQRPRKDTENYEIETKRPGEEMENSGKERESSRKEMENSGKERESSGKKMKRLGEEMESSGKETEKEITEEKKTENSYHTFLVGLLVGNDDWLVKSNVEAGEGRADIIAMTDDPDAGIVIELKRAKTAAGLEKACQEAMDQIKNNRYMEYLTNEGRNKVLLYGMAFYKKRCKVICEKFS